LSFCSFVSVNTEIFTFLFKKKNLINKLFEYRLPFHNKLDKAFLSISDLNYYHNLFLWHFNNLFVKGEIVSERNGEVISVGEEGIVSKSIDVELCELIFCNGNELEDSSWEFEFEFE